MSESESVVDINEMTLDPPGRIAVVGAGVLGLEAALYGRFLGYDVVVWERDRELGNSWSAARDLPLPVLPSAGLSGLARAAILAQGNDCPSPADQTFPLTVGQWIDQGWCRLAATDLLRGRIWTGCAVEAIELVEIAWDDDQVGEDDDPDMEVVGDVPPDFRLSIAAATAAPVPPAGHAGQSLDFEALILACGAAAAGAIRGIDACRQSPYCFSLGGAADAPLTETLPAGLQQIVGLYAQLGGRPGLDLYRPRRA